MNTGIGDVANLAWRPAANITVGILWFSDGSALLDAMEEEVETLVEAAIPSRTAAERVRRKYPVSITIIRSDKRVQGPCPCFSH